jgi:anti-sigma regulatory factor (Ser/Thr protein kinase)
VTARRTRPAVVLKVPSRTEFLAVVRDVTRSLAEVAGFNRGAAEEIALAVDEAATNVIEHAYGGATDRVVEVRYEDRGGDLRVDVVDNGTTVDPKAMPRVDLEQYATERRKGGLGVHLMSKIMDSVTFRRSARRNVCCLVRHKPEGAGSAEGAGKADESP